MRWLLVGMMGGEFVQRGVRRRAANNNNKTRELASTRSRRGCLCRRRWFARARDLPSLPF